ncbi:tannase/feruloyl esterase family alpha/beta hydrolase [Piscinibacter defluvii]|uniref:tannase/feruloyl esterase family alpha/beta hydrolase n=1 Tax=Piscinibacter defluvii TaxID=1796922 RepID=UPI000FDDC5FD|nr:tannase/feruloyl esterase family alpha/beta hydrolase [Piscinibacter defluvii]
MISFDRSLDRSRVVGIAALVVAATLSACGGGGNTPPPPVALTCDDTLKTAFKPDAQTSVVAVKAFKKGDALLLSGTAGGSTPAAASDICMVKLTVGPGNAGPAGAPSTSVGIGIEIWLPAKAAWNGRVHALGGGGWQGGTAGSATAIASTAAADVAANEGAVSSTTDTGHSTPGTGAFAMNPDGTINQTLWTDFASRGIHEQAVKTKALATAYYGSAPKFAYWEGGSTGGRQGLSLAQNHPEDYDGMVALYPAINWTRFITSELYPQIVYQRDLAGTPLSKAQSDLVSNAAIAACDVVGGQHLGYILDPSACTYDPTKDANVLCVASGGTNTTSSCVSTAQAQAMNKIWYGMTTDGTAPDPAADNGWSQAASSTLMGSGNQRWFGLTRGTTFYSPIFVGLASPDLEFPIASDMVALELQNPTIAGAGFQNATGNGQSLWKQMSYGQLSNAYDRGVALQTQFGGIDTNNPDLSAYKNRGGKILTWHGLADELIVPQGTINYYNRVAAQMGGMPGVQSFFRLYMVPGQGHGTPNGTSNPAAVIPAVAPGQMYALLTDWVENGTAPDQVTLQTTSGSATRSMPMCVYPKKITYVTGDPAVAASFSCS